MIRSLALVLNGVRWIIGVNSTSQALTGVTMIKLPVPLGMIFCKSMQVNQLTKGVALQGVLSSLRFPYFPSPPVAMSFFCYLTDGKGEGEMRLEIQRMFGDKPADWIWRARRWFVFPDNPLLQIPVYFHSQHKLCFPVAGEYLVQLSIDGAVILERSLSIFRKVK